MILPALLPLLAGPMVALAAGIAGWAAARSAAPAAAANDNAPRSPVGLRRARERRQNGSEAVLSKGKGEARRAAAGLSVIAADVTVAGDVRTDGDLHVDGTVEGDIACGTLVQGASGRIVGTVTARTARLAGTVEGQVQATALTIAKSARLRGDAVYQTVEVETGAQVDGRMTHRAGGQPAANDAPLRLVDASDSAG